MESNEKRFTVTSDHLTLLRNMVVRWCDDEAGAPCIDPKRPYGNSDVVGDIYELLDVGDLNAEEILALHEETLLALQIALDVAPLPIGEFVYREGWRRDPPGDFA